MLPKLKDHCIRRVIGITIILDPMLVDLINHFPTTARDTFQHKVNVLQRVSGGLGDPCRRYKLALYLSPALCLFCLSVKKAPILAPVQI